MRVSTRMMSALIGLVYAAPASDIADGFRPVVQRRSNATVPSGPPSTIAIVPLADPPKASDSGWTAIYSGPVDDIVSPGRSGGVQLITQELGNKKEHVGDRTGQFLYDLVHDCLLKLCSENELCVTDHSCRIDKIPYSMQGAYTSYNAHLTVQIKRWAFPYFKDDISKTRKIMQAFIHQAAGVFMKGSRDAKNCYVQSYKFNKEEAPYWCNIGDFAGIYENKWHSALEVTVEFNGKSLGGRYDCVAVKEAAVNFLLNDVANDFKDALQVDSFDNDISCTADDVTR